MSWRRLHIGPIGADRVSRIVPICCFIAGTIIASRERTPTPTPEP
jgi:hypothetical protein